MSCTSDLMIQLSNNCDSVTMRDDHTSHTQPVDGDCDCDRGFPDLPAI